MSLECFVDFSLACARRLPNVEPGHPCGRVHGHTFDVRLTVAGPVDPHTGWVVDFAEIEAVWHRLVFTVLDHRMLNEIEGLENPTSEHLAQWLMSRLAPALPLLTTIEIRESHRYGVRLVRRA